MNHLKTIIKAHIKANGPISIADYMDYCLLHPKYGYYTTQESIGEAGDFTTSPEISQCFGEMVALWVLDIVNQLRKTEPGRIISLAELGPGRGTLMSDILRTIQNHISADELKVILIEASDKLAASQREKLAQFHYNISWAENPEFVSDGPVIYIANEFFDALPIHQYVKDGGAIYERLIGLDDNGDFQFGLGPKVPGLGDLTGNDVPAGNQPQSVLEASPISQKILSHLTDNVARHGGGILAIDYGYAEVASGDTFQAMSKQRFANPLENPGKQDLTAHVNFSALKDAAMSHDVAIYPIIMQRDFLNALGIEYRAHQLANKNPDQSEQILGAVSRITDPHDMGTLFKVLQVTSKDICPEMFVQQPQESHHD